MAGDSTLPVVVDVLEAVVVVVGRPGPGSRPANLALNSFQVSSKCH